VFGLAWLTLPILLGGLSLLLALARVVWNIWFSPNAKWQAIHDWLLRKRAQEADEANRLEATETRIDKEPPSTGQDLVDRLNKDFDR
jgi:hypothetical protein